MQNGQDIVISYNNRPVYFLECKAKWNFNDAAHMSSQQMKQAVRHHDRYALLCVDCTSDTGAQVSPDADKDQVKAAHEDVLSHIYVHTEIGKLFKKTLGDQVDKEDDASINYSQNIRVYSSYSCDITKGIFVSGTPFFSFMPVLKADSRRIIENESQK